MEYQNNKAQHGPDRIDYTTIPGPITGESTIVIDFKTAEQPVIRPHVETSTEKQNQSAQDKMILAEMDVRENLQEVDLHQIYKNTLNIFDQEIEFSAEPDVKAAAAYNREKTYETYREMGGVNVDGLTEVISRYKKNNVGEKDYTKTLAYYREQRQRALETFQQNAQNLITPHIETRRTNRAQKRAELYTPSNYELFNRSLETAEKDALSARQVASEAMRNGVKGEDLDTAIDHYNDLAAENNRAHRTFKQLGGELVRHLDQQIEELQAKALNGDQSAISMSAALKAQREASLSHFDAALQELEEARANSTTTDTQKISTRHTKAYAAPITRNNPILTTPLTIQQPEIVKPDFAETITIDMQDVPTMAPIDTAPNTNDTFIIPQINTIPEQYSPDIPAPEDNDYAEFKVLSPVQIIPQQKATPSVPEVPEVPKIPQAPTENEPTSPAEPLELPTQDETPETKILESVPEREALPQKKRNIARRAISIFAEKMKATKEALSKKTVKKIAAAAMVSVAAFTAGTSNGEYRDDNVSTVLERPTIVENGPFRMDKDLTKSPTYVGQKIVINEGEGIYDVFAKAGLPQEEWYKNMQTLGPKLEALGVTYKADNKSTWGLATTGELSEDAVRVLKTELAGHLREKEKKQKNNVDK